MESDKKSVMRAWVLVLQLGLTAIAPIILCIAAAVVLKNYYQIDLMLPLCIVGIVTGTYSSYRMAAGAVGKDDEVTDKTSGIYDRARTDSFVEGEDALMEEFLLNNERRKAEIEGSVTLSRSEDEQ